MSFWTSASLNLRPIRRLTAKKVLCGLVTAWRLAEAPTSTSPSFVYATIDGVVRSPSLFSMTLALPPSMIATHELVVPRSMPMIFAMSGSSGSWFNVDWGGRAADTVYLGAPGPASSADPHPARFHAPCALLRRYHHHRRAQQAVVEHVALLEELHHRARGDVPGLGHAHRLVAFGVERLAGGGRDLDQAKGLRHLVELAQGQLDPGPQRVVGRRAGQP